MQFKSPLAAKQILSQGSVITLRPYLYTRPDDNLAVAHVNGQQLPCSRQYLGSVSLTLTRIDSDTLRQLEGWLPESGFGTVEFWVHEAWRLSGKCQFYAYRVTLQ